MASTRPTKNGKAHEAVWNIDGRQRTKAPFKGKREAQRYAEQMETDHRSGRYVDPHSPTTVIEFAREYAATKVAKGEHRGTTAARWASVIENHVAGTGLGRMRLVDVKRLHWDRWEAEQFAVIKSARYARKVISDVRSIFTAAVEYELIVKSPAPRRIGQSAPRSQRIEKTFTREEVEALIAAMAEIRPECVAMIVVQAGLGLRLGELIALRVRDVNRGPKTVRVATQITGEVKERTDELNTERSKATVCAPQYVIDALVEHWTTYPTGIDGSIFTNRGVAWQQNAYRRVFNRALERAGLPTTWRPHDLRHFCATTMLAEGKTYPQVARFLRDTVETVIKTYGHAVDDEAEVAADMDRAWARSS